MMIMRMVNKCTGRQEAEIPIAEVMAEGWILHEFRDLQGLMGRTCEIIEVSEITESEVTEEDADVSNEPDT